MGWGSIGGMIAGGIANSIGNAIKNNSNRKPSGGSSGGSGYIKPNNTGGASGSVPHISGGSGGSSISSGSQSSFGGGGSSGGSYHYNNITNNGNGYGGLTSAQYDEYERRAKQASAGWQNATTEAEKKAYHDDAVRWNTLLGRDYNDATGMWTGGYDRANENIIQDSWQAQKDGYDQWLQAQNEATQAAIAQGKLTLQQQLPGIQQSYDDAARQAYIQFMNAQKDLPQQLAAAGISGQGAAESTISGQSNAYQSVLSKSEQARRNAEQQIQNQVANLEATGDLQYVQNASDISKLTLQAYQNYLAQQQEQINADRLFGLQTGGMMGSYGGVPTFESQKWEDEKKTNAAAQEYERQMEQLRNALLLWDKYGYADQGIVKTLNGFGYTVPIGAGTSDQRHRDAEMALNKYLASRG